MTLAPPVINSRIVAWTDAAYLDTADRTERATLHVYSIATKKTRTLELGDQQVTRAPSLQLLGHKLFVLSKSRLARVVNAGA